VCPVVLEIGEIGGLDVLVLHLKHASPDHTPIFRNFASPRTVLGEGVVPELY